MNVLILRGSLRQHPFAVGLLHSRRSWDLGLAVCNRRLIRRSAIQNPLNILGIYIWLLRNLLLHRIRHDGRVSDCNGGSRFETELQRFLLSSVGNYRFK